MEKDKITEIQNIYDKFHQEFYSQKFIAIRDALKRISLKNRNQRDFFHDLGKFVIFYSLPTVNPKVVIIGNNPSWFHESNSTLAKENLDDVVKNIIDELAGNIESVTLASRGEPTLNQNISATTRSNDLKPERQFERW